MRKKLTLLLLLFVAFSCDTSKKPPSEEEALSPVEVPPSYLSVRINFPVSELESGVNQVLPTTLIDGAFPMKDDQDSLFLKIRREGDLQLSVRRNEVFASIPLNVTVSARKKVMGITFSNKDTPVTFSGTVKASTVVNLKDDWDMEFICSWRGFELEEEAKVSFMGLKFDVGNTINNIVDDYSDHLSDIICRSLRSSISLKEVLNNVWHDLQSTQRIAQNPKPLYLRSSPVALSGVLIPKNSDTLAIHLEYRTKIHVSPENRLVVNKASLNERADPLNTKPSFLAYPELFIPYPFLEEALNAELKGKLFQYEKHKATITDVVVRRSGQRLEIQLSTEGDLQGRVFVEGKPALNDKMEFNLGDFKYRVEAQNKWIKMTDFALHQFAEGYLSEQVKFDLAPYFNGLDELIMQEVGRSPLGTKIALRVSFDRISSYDVVLTESGLQWILMVEGKASINLKGAVINSSNS